MPEKSSDKSNLKHELEGLVAGVIDEILTLKLEALDEVVRQSVADRIAPVVETQDRILKALQSGNGTPLAEGSDVARLVEERDLLQRRVEELQAQSQKRKDKHKQLQEERRSLHDRLLSAMAEIEELKKQKAKQSDASTTKVTIKSPDGTALTVAQAEAALRDAAEAQNVLRAEQEKFRVLVRSREEAEGEQLEEYRKLQTAHVKAQEELQRLKREMSEEGRGRNQLSAVRDELERTRAEARALQEDLTSHGVEALRNRQEIAQLKADLKRETEAHEQFEKGFRDASAELNEARRLLAERDAAEAQRLQAFKEEHDTHVASLEEQIVSFHVELDELKRELERTRAALAAESEARRVVEADLRLERDAIVGLQRDAKAAEEKVAAIKADMQAARDDYQEKVKALKQQLVAGEEQRSRLKAQLDAERVEVRDLQAQLRKERETVSARNAQETVARNQVMEEFESKSTELARLRSDLEALEAQRTMERAAWEQERSDLAAALEKATAAMQSATTDAETRVAEQAARMQQMEGQLQEALARLQEVTLERNATDNALAELERDLDSARQEILRLSEPAEAVPDAGMLADLAEARAAVEQLQAELAIARARGDEIDAESLQADIEELRAANQALQARHSDLEGRHEALLAKSESLQSALASAEVSAATADDLKQRVSELEAQLKQATRVRAQLEEKVAALQESQDSEKELQALRLEVERLQAEASSHSTHAEAIAEAEHQLERLREQHTAALARIATFEQQAMSAEDVGQLTGRLGAALEKIEQLEQELARREKALQVARRENDQLKANANRRSEPVSRPSDDDHTLDLERTIKDQKRLLDEAYRERNLLRDELEKEQREKYERLKMVEREKKSLADSSSELEQRLERERQEKALLEAELQKYTKKKWLFG